MENKFKNIKLPDVEIDTQIVWAVVFLLSISTWLLPEKAGELMGIGIAGLFALSTRGGKSGKSD